MLKHLRESQGKLVTEKEDCPPMEGANRAEMPAIRECQAEVFYKTALYKNMRNRYRVAITPQKVGGIYTEVFTPAEGVARKSKQRVLMNGHGGGFAGSRTLSQLDSIPIAVVGSGV